MTSGAEFRKRRFSRNVFVAGALGLFVALIFGVSLVKFPQQMEQLCEQRPEKCPFPTQMSGDAQ